MIALVPFIGWILGAVIGGIVNLVEMLAVLLDPRDVVSVIGGWWWLWLNRLGPRVT
ncbi:MAG: hypothetical protein WAO22_06995 [bacterium]